MSVSWMLRLLLHVEDNRLSEQQLVDCSKQSSGCNGSLTVAASAFYMIKVIVSRSSGPGFQVL